MPPRTPLRLLQTQGDQLLRNRYGSLYRIRRSVHGSVRVSEYFPRGSGSCRTCCRPGIPNGSAQPERGQASRFVQRVTGSSGERFDRIASRVGERYIPQQAWCVGAAPRGADLVKNSMSAAGREPVGAPTEDLDTRNSGERQQPQRLRRLKSFTATTRNWLFGNRREHTTSQESEILGLKTKRSFSSASKMAFHDSTSFTNVLDSNTHWREKITKRNPDLLPSLAVGQKPTILWVGCSDSRCPETTILGLQPGDVFVHRNIANILHAGDVNSNAVIEYAVRYLGVKHVVLSGHTQCGGVAAALGNAKVGGVLDVWLAPLRKLRKEFASELAEMGDKEKAVRLVELNVLAGVQTLKEKDVVIEARRKGELQIHGVVYEVGTGIIRELDIPVDEGAEEKTVEAFELK